MKNDTSLAQLFISECEPYAPMVYRHCLQLLRHRQEAEDAAQETMLRAFRAYHSYRGDGVASWLFRIAHNTCLDVMKSARYKRESLLPEDAPPPVEPGENPEEAYLSQADRNILWGAVSRLPVEQQEALQLYYGQQMSYGEIARALGVAEGTVKSRLSRAKEGLRASGDLTDSFSF